MLALASQQFFVSRISMEHSLLRVLRQLQLSACSRLLPCVLFWFHAGRVLVVLLQLQFGHWLCFAWDFALAVSSGGRSVSLTCKAVAIHA